MGDVYIRVPVACPICSQESLVALRAEAILDALEAAAPLRLSTPCHRRAWCANSIETDQIREYLLATYNFATSNQNGWIGADVEMTPKVITNPRNEYFERRGT